MTVIGSAARAVARVSTAGKGKRCPVCGSDFAFFLPHPGALLQRHGGMRAELGGVGSDLWRHICPSCRSNDRERHLFVYFEAEGLFGAMAGSRILHFAPEPHLRQRLLDSAPTEYVAADLYPQDDAVTAMDIESIPFPDEHFDLVIANHVLEHVSDDVKAMSEVARVLRPGGRAVLQVPFCSRMRGTITGVDLASDRARLMLHGQADHLRSYGRDYPQRVAGTGLLPRVVLHADRFEPGLARRVGVNPTEPFLQFVKPGA